MLSFDYNCSLEQLFDLLHKICSTMEEFWSIYLGGNVYKGLKSERAKNLVAIVIILISILIFVYAIITNLKLHR